jgi:ATP-binding cassette subfamily F protein 3
MIRLQQLQKSFGARTLFEDVSYHFPAGERVALVGANGAGKTTLLNIICGLDAADHGEVLIPANVQLGYLPQKPNDRPAATVLDECVAGAEKLIALKREMDACLRAVEGTAQPSDADLHRYETAETAFRLGGGYALEAKATSILKGLGFTTAMLGGSPKELSGGWRMRLELARLFIRDPDFLILDEPTNHLDLPSLVWVENYLRGFRGTLLFVSHDRALLNRLASLTLHLFKGKVTPYKGNFDAFLEAREQRLEHEAAALEQLKRRRETMERFVERFGAKASKASQAQSRVKMIARLRDLEERFDSDQSEDGVAIVLPPPPKAPRIVYGVDDGAIGYDRPLASKIGLTVEKGARIAVIGANGIGKSTLLKTIAGRLPPLGGRFTSGSGVEIAYFAQDQMDTLRLADTVLANLMRESELGEKGARSLLGSFLFRGDDVFKAASVLSGGELSRLGLACVLAKKASFLLLDEPTNHLDMTSVETLSAGLGDYEGTLLFVSHDRTFIDSVCSHVFAMLPDGRSMLFPGKLEDYKRLAAVAGFPNVLEVEDAKADGGPARDERKSEAMQRHQDGRELKKRQQQLSTRSVQLDKSMHAGREKARAIEAKLAAIAPQDFTAAAALNRELEATQAAVDADEEAWLEVMSELEGLETELKRQGRR